MHYFTKQGINKSLEPELTLRLCGSYSPNIRWEMWTKAKAFFDIVRPFNCLLAFFGVMASAHIAGSSISSSTILFTCLSAVFIMISGNVINDYFDANTDKIVKPYRPIPRNDISLTESRILYLIACFGAITASILVGNPLTILFAVTGVTIAFMYSWKIKKRGFIGNIIACIPVGGICFFGWSISQNILEIRVNSTLLTIFFLALLSFLMSVARQTIKGFKYIVGENSSYQIGRSLAVTHGARFAGVVGSLFLLGPIAISPFPYILRLVNNAYIVPILITDTILFIASFSMFSTVSEKNIERIQNLIRVGVIFGFLAFDLGVSS